MAATIGHANLFFHQCLNRKLCNCLEYAAFYPKPVVYYPDKVFVIAAPLPAGYLNIAQPDPATPLKRDLEDLDLEEEEEKEEEAKEEESTKEGREHARVGVGGSRKRFCITKP